MVAAGWGATGTIAQECVCEAPLTVSCSDSEPFDEPSRIRIASPLDFVRCCSRVSADRNNSSLAITNYDDLRKCDLPDHILSFIKSAGEISGHDGREELIVIVFLYVLSRSVVGGKFDHHTKRAIDRAMKNRQPDEELITVMTEAFAYISEDVWGGTIFAKI